MKFSIFGRLPYSDAVVKTTAAAATAETVIAIQNQ